MARPHAAGTPRRSLDPRLVLVLGAWCGGLLLLLLVQPWRAAHGWYGTDWMSFVTGGRLLDAGAGTTLYDPAVQLREQTAVIGQPPVAGLDPYPLFPLFALLISPLAALPPLVSTVVWALLMAAALVLSAVVLSGLLPAEWGRTERLLVLSSTVVLLPLVDAVAWGQVTPLLLLLLALAVRRTVRHGDDVVAGLLLAGVALKPQLVWLLVVLLVVAGARRTLAGLAAGAAVWATSTLALVGVEGVRHWLVDLLPGQYAGQSVDGATLMSLLASAGLPARAAFAVSLATAGGLVVLAVCGRGRLAARLPVVIAAGVALSAALSPHAFSRDLALAAPAVLLLAARRPRAACAVALALGLAYLLDARYDAWGQTPEAAVGLAAIAAVSVMAARMQWTARAAAPEPAAAAA